MATHSQSVTRWWKCLSGTPPADERETAGGDASFDPGVGTRYGARQPSDFPTLADCSLFGTYLEPMRRRNMLVDRCWSFQRSDTGVGQHDLQVLTPGKDHGHYVADGDRRANVCWSLHLPRYSLRSDKPGQPSALASASSRARFASSSSKLRLPRHARVSTPPSPPPGSTTMQRVEQLTDDPPASPSSAVETSDGCV
jgi:hypothetical protein